jgi:hypothetical protein
MTGPWAAAAPHGEQCPRCGAALRFEDDDGARECVCGWSERARAANAPDAPALEAEDDEPMIL